MRPAALALLLAGACAPKPDMPRQSQRQTIEGLTLSQSVDGEPRWTLRSRLAVLREESGAASLEAPTMEFYRDGRAVSRVTAAQGSVRTDTHDVRLSSSVVLDSLTDRSRLTTDELLYSSKAGRFHTDSDVLIRRPEGVVRGRGLDASPDLSVIRVYDQRATIKNGAPR
ncbi:MAG: LPS export ABC transporter periplasmic protein LptC [Elusimicrobia bacterium]|nr:LPS export ABC transporter periplasmic protein LptC [Elusimicrobiota bacterium]